MAPSTTAVFSPVASKERPPSPPKQEKTQASTGSKDKGKGGKGKDKGKDKDGKGGSRPPSQQFDNSKPHWTLRIVSDAAAEVNRKLYGIQCTITKLL